MHRRVTVALVGLLWLVPAGASFALDGPDDDADSEVAGIEASSMSAGLERIGAEGPDPSEQQAPNPQGLATTSGASDRFRSIVGMGAGLAVLIGLATMAGHRLEREA